MVVFKMFSTNYNMKHNYLKCIYSKKVLLLSFLIFSYVFNNVYCQSPVTFNYTGNVQTWIVPPCVTTINVTVAGAKGGGTNGGNGAVVQGSLAVTPGQVLNIYCGGMGTQGAASGGWNGGGTGHNSTGSATYRSWGGGGASDIRIGGTALANRVVVAGGGGGRSGGSSPVCGGAGGGAVGTAGCSTFGAGGGGGTQTAGGAGGTPWAGTPPGGSPGTLGVGGQGGYWQTASGGGGGGGRYGGGGGGNDGCCTGANGGGGGGGGSSLLPPIAGVFLGATNAQNGYVTITFAVGPGNATATNTGPYCAGATIQLNGTGGVSYSWIGPNGFTSNVQNPTIPSSIVANSGIYTLTATSPGCVSTATTNVVVNPIPIVDAGPNQSICENTPVTLSGSGATTYTWTGGVTDGVTFVPPVGSNTYFVTGTTSGCIGLDNVTITVNPNPTVNAGTDQTICFGDPVTLTGVLGGTTNIAWDNGVNDGIAFNPTTTQTYTATATTTFGCTATDNVLVTVNPLPVVNGGPDQTVCENTLVTLTATGANTYSWNNGITNGIAFTPTVGSLDYIVTGTSGLNCINTDTVSVTVNPNPLPVITGPSSYCANNIPTLNTTLSYSSYNWSTGTTTPSTTATQLNNPITVTVTNNFNCSATSAPFSLVELPVITTNSSINICQGQSATIHGVSQTTSGIYSATFTSILGCDSTSNVTLTVLPLPIIDGGADQTVCENISVTLTATGANTYIWNNGVTNAVAFTPNLGTLSYIVTGTDNNQCSNTDTVQVTVNPNPIPVITGPLTYCANVPPTLNTTLPYASYNWTTGALTATTTATQVNNPITVTVTNNFNCSATSAPYSLTELSTVTTNSSITVCQGQSVTIHGIPQTTSGVYTGNYTNVLGCDSISNVTLTVLPLPAVSAGSDKVVCEGTQVTLLATGANTYSWTGAVTNGVPFIQNPGSVTYIVTGIDNNLCSNTDTVVVTVNAFPIVNAGNDQQICAGESITLNGAGASTYTWNLNVIDGVAFTPVTTQTYTVTGTDVNGCQDTDQVTVTVNQAPIVFAGADVSICENATVILAASGANTYVWNSSVLNGVAFVPGNAGSYTYTVTGTDNNGCEDSDDVTVTVISLPNVSFTADVTSGCVPLSVNFTNTGDSGVNCNWSMGDGTVINDCGNVNHLFTQLGCTDITLTVTNSTGCTNNQVLANYICVEGPPTANFIATPGVINEFESTVNFNNTSSNAATYVWDFGDNSGTSSETDPEHEYDGSVLGNYTVTLYAYSALGCIDSVQGAIQYQEELIYYVPNCFTPDGDMYNQTFKPIFTSGFDPYNYALYIYDRWGELIFESRDAQYGWDGTYNGKLVQQGSYTWKIEFKAPNNDKKYIETGYVIFLK
jgi:gliding motility-associated-like protein